MKKLFLILFSLAFSLLLADYNWIEIKKDNVKFIGSRSDSVIIKQLSVKLQKEINNFQMRISQYPKHQVKIVVAPDKEFYQKLIGKNRGIIEFSEAFFSHGNKTIYIKNLDNVNFNSLNRILLHEYIHLFVDYYFSDAPLWFHEGMAVYFSDPLDYGREINFAFDHIVGNIPDLANMEKNYPENRAKWRSFYSLSALTLKYLYDEEKKSFYLLWDLAEKDYTFERAFRTSFFMSLPRFYKKMDNILQERLKVEILMSLSGFIWALLPIILIIGWIRKRIKLSLYRKQDEINKLDSVSENIRDHDDHQES